MFWNKSKKDVALVLSSGGARGIAQIGVIRELEERGYRIRSIAGTSIGALIGGLYLTGSLDAYSHWVSTLKQFDIFQLLDFSFSSKGILKADKVFEKMEGWIGGYMIEDLPLPYTAVAADIARREEKVFTSGSLEQAIRASIAIPNIIQPVKLNDSYLHDGSIINPIPLGRIKRRRGDILVAVNLNADIPDFDPYAYWNKENEPRNTEQFYKKWISKWFPSDNSSKEKTEKNYPGIFATTTGLIDIMQDRISRASLKAIPPDILIDIPINLCSTFEFYRSSDLIEYGKNAAREALDRYE